MALVTMSCIITCLLHGCCLKALISLSSIHALTECMHALTVNECIVLSHGVGPNVGIDNCSSTNVLPRQVTLVWSLNQLLVQNITFTEYTINCSSIGSIITTSATSVNITTGIVPYTNYTCTLAAETTAGTSAPTTCEFETVRAL